MLSSVLLAKIIGPVFMVVALGLVLNRDHYAAMINDFIASPALTYISSLIALVLGIVLVRLHNIWVFDWPVVMTILIWLSLLKGITGLIAPQLLLGVSRKFAGNPLAFLMAGIVYFVTGLLLTYIGYNS